MTRVYSFNPHRWIIFFHVAFIVQSKVTAQSDPKELQSDSGQAPAKTTVFAVLITIFFVVGFLFVYYRRCSRSNPRHYQRRRHAYEGCPRQGGLDDAVVESFPVFSYSSVKESKIGSEDLECAICLNELEDRETVRLLPICNHLFHIDCIDAWLYSHATCPVCRSDLTAKSDESGEVNESPIRDQVAIEIEEGLEKISHREISGKFPRSNSTGHSMVRFGDCMERFTLRLPDDVKRKLMTAKGRRLKRARSFDGVLTAAESGYTVGSGEKSDRVNWVDRLGLFVTTKSNSGSVRSQKSNGESLK